MFESIIWATDGSETADRALPLAKSLAAASGCPLTVVHGRELFAGAAAGYAVLADDEALQAKIHAQAAAARDEGLEVTLRIGTPVGAGVARVIADTAEEIGADLIVAGTRGHSAIGGLLIGSVTRQLLHIASCPVLAVPVHGPLTGQRAGEPAGAVAS